VQRLAFALLVGILSFSATGVAGLILGEPCLSLTLSNEDDGNCPPTCVTCGCCAQAAEPTAVVVASSLDVPVPHFAAVLPPFTETDPRDILHVPRQRSA
jgi:hypothetical protein